jgi:predicted permease
VIIVVIGKLFLLPAAVWAGLYIMEMIGYPIDNPDLHKAAIIMAATPGNVDLYGISLKV